MYLYLCITCKTPGCHNIGVLKYFGSDTVRLEIQEATPTAVLYQCGACRMTHRYESEDMYPYKANVAPPAGWHSALEH